MKHDRPVGLKRTVIWKRKIKNQTNIDHNDPKTIKKFILANISLEEITVLKAIGTSKMEQTFEIQENKI